MGQARLGQLNWATPMEATEGPHAGRQDALNTLLAAACQPIVHIDYLELTAEHSRAALPTLPTCARARRSRSARQQPRRCYFRRQQCC